MIGYLLRILDAVSQLLNCILHPITGESNHSISGDAYRFNRRRTMAVLDFLFSPVERDHCRLSHEAELTRAAKLLAEPRP